MNYSSAIWSDGTLFVCSGSSSLERLLNRGYSELLASQTPMVAKRCTLGLASVTGASAPILKLDLGQRKNKMRVRNKEELSLRAKKKSYF